VNFVACFVYRKDCGTCKVRANNSKMYGCTTWVIIHKDEYFTLVESVIKSSILHGWTSCFNAWHMVSSILRSLTGEQSYLFIADNNVHLFSFKYMHFILNNIVNLFVMPVWFQIQNKNLQS